MAQQMREIQRKEAEQLRELQHMKAKFKLSEFDSELEFVSVLEMKRAEQLGAKNTKSLDLKRERRDAKKNILKLREQAKIANNLELNALKAKQLKLIEENRADELKNFQIRENKRQEEQFESEIALMEAEMKEMMESTEFDLSTYASRSGTGTSAGGTNKSATSGASEHQSQDTHDTHDTQNTDSTGTHQSSELEKQMVEEDDIEFRKKIEAMRAQAKVALEQADR